MSDMLQTEDYESLSVPQTNHDPLRRKIRPASFPSVSQLEPDLLGEMTLALKRWMTAFTKSLTKHIRVACAFRAIENEIVSHTRLQTPEDISFWGVMDGHENHRILLSFPRRFAVSICERVFGAPFEEFEDRALTDVESRVLADLSAEWMSLLRVSWEGIHVRLEVPDSDLAHQETVSAHWILFKADLICGAISGEIRLFMGGATARHLLGHSNVSGRELGDRAAVCDLLGAVPLEMQAVLGRSEFTLDDLISLNVGDVITLDRRSYDPIDILIDGRSAFHARAGLSGQMVALDIISAAHQEKNQ
jgi:flagellar motor switch protein FliM